MDIPDRPLKISKNQLKKVKIDGYLNGRNKVFFSEEGKHNKFNIFSGNKYTLEDIKTREISQNILDSANREDEPVLDYIKKKHLNEEEDKTREKQRIREKRLKKKIKGRKAAQPMDDDCVKLNIDFSEDLDQESY